MIARRAAAVLFVAAAFLLVGSRPVPAQQSVTVWVAFRYDAERVLSYVETLRDPVRQDYSRPMASPKARYGAGGYLLPLTAERLRTFRPIEPPRMPIPGQAVTIMLGGDLKVTGTVEEYVEQWGSENPIVSVGILARIASADRERFRMAPSDYFLLAATRSPAPPATVANRPVLGTTRVLNRFGMFGDLILEELDAGWRVTLFRQQNGLSRPTDVRYFYGD